MNIRELAIICHNATRPVIKAMSCMSLKWGQLPQVYKENLIQLVQDNIDHTASCPSADTDPMDLAVHNIVGTVVNALRDKVES